MWHPYLLESQSTCSPLSKLPRAPVGKLELDASSPREFLGLFIHYQSVPLFLPNERFLSSLYYSTSYFYCKAIFFSNALPPCSKDIVPSPMVTYLPLGYSLSRNSMLLPEKLPSILHLLASVVVPCF